MPKITLDLGSIEKYFFRNQRLLAIAAPSVPDYRFCWNLNHYLGMDFNRRPDMDIPLETKQHNNLYGGELFSHDLKKTSKTQYFPIYKHNITGSELCVLLYCNKSEGSVLIKEMKAIDFFILFPNNPNLYEFDKINQCDRMKCITWMKEIPLDNSIKLASLVL